MMALPVGLIDTDCGNMETRYRATQRLGRLKMYKNEDNEKPQSFSLTGPNFSRVKKRLLHKVL